MRPSGNTILITGGTSGIGRALAERLHQRDNRVIIAGRRQALLDEVTRAHPGMRALPLDVEDPRAVAGFASRVREEFPGLNVLFNNAGVSRPEDLSQGGMDLSLATSLIQTNILGVLQVTAGLLPLLKKQPTSTLITTTSGLAFLPLAGFPTYCATKAFLHSWVQSVRAQLRQTSVEVLELIPPYVQTELSGANQARDPHAMPLSKYADEVVEMVAAGNFPNGEILSRRAEELRWAERNGRYGEVFEARNGRWLD
jgi:uncharacterized oxidoreductase